MENDSTLDIAAALQAEVDAEEQVIHELIEEIEALENLLSPQAQELIRDLRPITVTDDVYDDLQEKALFTDRLSDQMATLAGSWSFIGTFVFFMMVWMVFNVYLHHHAFDPYPFILLNLGLSTLAALQAPVILMSQNRQAGKDRAVAQNDFHVNLKNELEIADLHRKLDTLIGTIDFQGKLLNVLVETRRYDMRVTRQAIEQLRQTNIPNPPTDPPPTPPASPLGI